MSEEVSGYSSTAESNNRYNRRLRRFINSAILVFGATITATAYLDFNNISEEHYTEAKQNMEEAQQLIDNLRDDKEETESNILRVKQGLGEACTSKVAVFMPGGVLEETKEDSIVSDLINEPGTPCGETQIDVRVNVRKLSLEYDKSQRIIDNINENESEIPELTRNLERESDNELDGELGTLAVGGLAFAFGGIIGYGAIYSTVRKH